MQNKYLLILSMCVRAKPDNISKILPLGTSSFVNLVKSYKYKLTVFFKCKRKFCVMGNVRVSVSGYNIQFVQYKKH